MWQKFFPIILLLIAIPAVSCNGQNEDEMFTIGIIGLDTSHVTAFTGFINDPNNKTGCKITTAFVGGSSDIEASASRLEKFTNELKEKYNVKIVDSIEKLCEEVDGVLLESLDGRCKIEQVKPVIAAGKPVFIDKPVSANLKDVIKIYEMAKAANVPCWSSSVMRFSPYILELKQSEKVGEVLEAEAFSPCSFEEHHPDLYWYGIHGVETLYTIMGPGCETVSRIHTKDTDLVVGVWKDGKVGTFRGRRTGGWGIGALVYGTKGIDCTDKWAGYEPLVKEIITFFKTGNVPVSAEETIEIFAFMDAADKSKAQNGAPVSVQLVIEEAKKKAAE